MGLEAATFIADLITTNPLGSDKKSQGDDHIRLLKTVLKNTFPNANKAFTASRGLTKTSAYSVLATDDKTVISVDTTSGVFNLTLPVLAVADAGWSIDVIKVNTGPNNVFLAPASGTINGLAYVRRTLEYLLTRVVWTGSNFYASRPNGGNVGELRHFAGPNLPNDCLWPDGQAFSAGNYLELNAALGVATKPDVRGTVLAGRDNMGVGARGFLGVVNTDSGQINGSAMWSVGGSQTHVQTGSELVSHAHSAGLYDPSHTHGASTHAGQFVLNNNTAGLWNGGGGGGIGSVVIDGAYTGVRVQGDGGALDVTYANGGSQGMSMLQPTIVMNVGLVAE